MDIYSQCDKKLTKKPNKLERLSLAKLATPALGWSLPDWSPERDSALRVVKAMAKAAAYYPIV